MGKTKTAFVPGTDEGKISGEEKYKERLKKKILEAEKSHETEKGGKTQLKGVGLKGGQRIKIIGGEVPEVPSDDTSTSSETSDIKKKDNKKIKVRSKKYSDAKAKIDQNKKYTLKEAVSLVKKTTYSKFNGTVELHLVVKKKGLSLNCDLPYSSGKTRRVETANEDTLKKLAAGKADFDILLATPEMMPKLIPFAKLLGPKGLMPNPKNGTIIKSTKDADKFKGNSILIKTEKDAPLIHTIVGKTDQDDGELVKNSETIINAVTSKQIERAYLKSTMSPSVKIAI